MYQFGVQEDTLGQPFSKSFGANQSQAHANWKNLLMAHYSKDSQNESFKVKSQFPHSAVPSQGQVSHKTRQCGDFGTTNKLGGTQRRRNSLFSDDLTLSREDSQLSFTDLLFEPSSRRRNSLLLAASMLGDQYISVGQNANESVAPKLFSKERTIKRRDSLLVAAEFLMENLVESDDDLPQIDDIEQFFDKESDKTSENTDNQALNCRQQTDCAQYPTLNGTISSQSSYFPQEEKLTMGRVGQPVSNQAVQFPFNLDQGTIVKFLGTMKSTRRSQMKIHQWDKKMGLRRSHSKTMRNSMKTRKKLQKMFGKRLLYAKCADRKSVV